MAESKNARDAAIDKILDKILQVISESSKPERLANEQPGLSIRDEARIQARKKLAPKL